jgi:molybdate transport system substrate-binding protein
LPLLLLLVLWGCGPETSATRKLTVFAASSLSEAFPEVGAAFERSNPGAAVTFNFGGSAALRAQLELGARADLFTPADMAQMEQAWRAGVVEAGWRVFAVNRLVVLTPAREPEVKRLQDMAAPGVRLVMGQPAVPVGAYASLALDRMEADPAFGVGFKGRVMANVVSLEPNVGQMVAKVNAGEVDATIAYATSASGGLATIPIPDRYNVVALYPVALAADPTQPDLARAFVDFLLSNEGQGILKAHGFGSPPHE